MDEARLEDKLKELVKEFGGTDNNQYKKLASLAQDYLRICIKYQLFDLEATRRENKYLRKLLEEKES